MYVHIYELYRYSNVSHSHFRDHLECNINLKRWISNHQDLYISQSKRKYT